ncbi:MAG: plasmid mobilization relaxosome protein MobC [Clostridia bacterium]|nr:plasmid mobilization relaxosome protein MobC [Clostridia bacterium]
MLSEKEEKVNVNFRLPLSEKKKLQERAKLAHMSLSGYLVSLSENKRIVVSDSIPKLILEISRVGTNINQIAHIGNTQKYVSKELLQSAIESLDEIKSITQKILSEIYDEDEHTFRSLERKIDILIEKMDNKNGSS